MLLTPFHVGEHEKRAATSALSSQLDYATTKTNNNIYSTYIVDSTVHHLLKIHSGSHE
jgi:hypothetical protein